VASSLEWGYKDWCEAIAKELQYLGDGYANVEKSCSSFCLSAPMADSIAAGRTIERQVSDLVQGEGVQNTNVGKIPKSL
jgi:hypothetical protein